MSAFPCELAAGPGQHLIAAVPACSVGPSPADWALRTCRGMEPVVASSRYLAKPATLRGRTPGRRSGQRVDRSSGVRTAAPSGMVMAAWGVSHLPRGR